MQLWLQSNRLNTGVAREESPAVETGRELAPRRALSGRSLELELPDPGWAGFQARVWLTPGALKRLEQEIYYIA